MLVQVGCYSIYNGFHGMLQRAIQGSSPHGLKSRNGSQPIIMRLQNSHNLIGSPGLFERHKLLFSFQMTIKIMEADGKIKQEELDFFLKGNIALEKSARQKPFPWVPDQGWEDVIRLVSVTPEVFGSLADDIERNEKAWKEVIGHSSNRIVIILFSISVFRLKVLKFTTFKNFKKRRGEEVEKEFRSSGIDRSYLLCSYD